MTKKVDPVHVTIVNVDESNANNNTVNTVQNPLPTDGDSVYEKDIWVDESDSTGWTGDIKSPFNNLHSEIYNDSTDNPKTLFIHFNRTVYSNAVGFGSTSGGEFKNLEVEFIGSGGVTRYTHDLIKNDDTARTSYLAETPSLAFNAIRLNFYTADKIDITNITIRKAITTDSILKAKKPDGTFTNIDATAGGNLKVSVEEFDDAANPIRSDLEGGGKVSVGTTPVEVTFVGSTKSIIITADINNTGVLYIGKSNVLSDGSNALTFLLPGEDVTLDYDDSTNALYVVSDTTSQNFWKGSLL